MYAEKKYWGESEHLSHVTDVNIGDIVLFKFNREWYTLGWVFSNEVEHTNIFGDSIKGYLICDSETDSNSSTIIIAQKSELRQNSETKKMTRAKRITLILE